MLEGDPLTSGHPGSRAGGNEAEERGRDRTAAGPPAPAGPEGDPIKILLVDDEDVLRDLMRQAIELTTSFAVVGEAGNGFEALERVAELEPDVVVMDARMPLMDGVEATRLIKERFPNVRVLATSGDPEAVEAMLAVGATGRVPKRNVKQLADALEKLAREQNSA